MSTYFVKGPIYNGNDVMLCVFDGIIPYYVCYKENGYRLSIYSTSIDIAIFRVANNGASLYDMRYNNYALIDENNELNINHGTSIIEYKGNKYQPWLNSSINSMSNIAYLAGESYQMNIRLDGIAFNLTYVIPCVWYQRGLCRVKQDYQSALANHQFSLTNANNVQGWTTQPECYQDVWYTYCDQGISCSSGCKAPCSNPNKECLFIDGQFQCGQMGEWYKADWFLVLLCLALIIVIVYYLFDLFERSKNPGIDQIDLTLNKSKDGYFIGQ